MRASEVTCVSKIYSNEKKDVFSYRDMFNETKTIEFPQSWSMTIEEVENYLLDYNTEEN